MQILKRLNHKFQNFNAKAQGCKNSKKEIEILSKSRIGVFQTFVAHFSLSFSLKKRQNYMGKKPKILAFAGSLREHSYSKRVVKTARKGAEF